MRKAAALLSLALFAARFVLPAAFAEPVSVPVTVTYGQTEARTMLQMINGFRAGTRQDAPEGTAVPGHPWQRAQDGGIEALDPRGALVYDAQLERIAMLRAAEIAIYFEHTRPNGSEWSAVERRKLPNIYLLNSNPISDTCFQKMNTAIWLKRQRITLQKETYSKSCFQIELKRILKEACLMFIGF